MIYETPFSLSFPYFINLEKLLLWGAPATGKAMELFCISRLVVLLFDSPTFWVTVPLKMRLARKLGWFLRENEEEWSWTVRPFLVELILLLFLESVLNAIPLGSLMIFLCIKWLRTSLVSFYSMIVCTSVASLILSPSKPELYYARPLTPGSDPRLIISPFTSMTWWLLWPKSGSEGGSRYCSALPS